jgi:[acyl-carrier-protein] S-malonyltransferase
MLAFIFPGQGSQASGMGRDLAENFSVARAVFEEANDALGINLSRICFEGSAEELQLTENTQPAILTVSTAAFRVMETEGLPRPSFVAGHSLGEYSALVAAKAIDLADAVRVVRMRGRFMQEAVPVGVGAMAAVIGADLETIQTACRDASEGEVCSPANINSPKQIVIAGHAGAVERAMMLLKDRGARRVVRLPVSAPFHCSLMRPAQDRLAEVLREIKFRDLQIPLVTNSDAKVIETGDEARESLIKQVSATVKWSESIEVLTREHELGTFVETGPGKVLSGLVRQIAPEAVTLNVEDAASLRATIDKLGSGAN